MSSHFGSPAPILRVADVRASVAYYVKILGFRMDWEEAGFVSLTRGHCTVFVTDADQSQARMWIWIGVGDVQALHKDLTKRGARVRQEPTNHRWALEMQVEDLDGNVLRLGSEPLDGEPFGQFLDASGRRWSPPSASDSEPA